jgi:hypothetical protein
MAHVSTSYAERNNLNVRMHLTPHDAAHECVFKEDGKPRSRDVAAFFLLQLRPYS